MAINARNFMTLHQMVGLQFRLMDKNSESLLLCYRTIMNGFESVDEDDDFHPLLSMFFVDSSGGLFHHANDVNQDDEPFISYLAKLYLFKNMYEHIQAQPADAENLPRDWAEQAWEELNQEYEELPQLNNQLPSAWSRMTDTERKVQIDRLIVGARERRDHVANLKEKYMWICCLYLFYNLYCDITKTKASQNMLLFITVGILPWVAMFAELFHHRYQNMQITRLINLPDAIVIPRPKDAPGGLETIAAQLQEDRQSAASVAALRDSSCHRTGIRRRQNHDDRGNPIYGRRG